MTSQQNQSVFTKAIQQLHALQADIKKQLGERMTEYIQTTKEPSIIRIGQLLEEHLIDEHGSGVCWGNGDGEPDELLFHLSSHVENPFLFGNINGLTLTLKKQSWEDESTTAFVYKVALD